MRWVKQRQMDQLKKDALERCSRAKHEKFSIEIMELWYGAINKFWAIYFVGIRFFHRVTSIYKLYEKKNVDVPVPKNRITTKPARKYGVEIETIHLTNNEKNRHAVKIWYAWDIAQRTMAHPRDAATQFPLFLCQHTHTHTHLYIDYICMESRRGDKDPVKMWAMARIKESNLEQTTTREKNVY